MDTTHKSSFDCDHQPMGSQPESRMTQMIDLPQIGHILDLLEVRFRMETPEVFENTLDEIEAIL